jgi:hypothetical protein
MERSLHVISDAKGLDAGSLPPKKTSSRAKWLQMDTLKTYTTLIYAPRCERIDSLAGASRNGASFPHHDDPVQAPGSCVESSGDIEDIYGIQSSQNRGCGQWV